MAIPVAQEQVDESGRQEGPNIRALVLMLLEAVEQLVGADDLVCAGEAGTLVRLTLFDRAEQAAEDRAELAQRGIVREEHEPGGRMHHVRSVENRAHHEGRGGMAGAHLVLEDLLHDGVLELNGQQWRWILVQRAKRVLAAVATLEAQRLGLLAAPRSVGRRPPAKRLRSRMGTRTGVVHRSR